ncbi:MAG: D-cysteine desulfhydrase family protein [Candidatus Aminicenantes bacterium]|nr:D-cysteine desulfhydrase family protein [Candidatus Aminicenantes bacterium]
MNPEAIRTAVDKFPRVELIHRPTPMRKLEAVSAELGGPEIWVKREDLTGLAFGGNKTRKLEFIIPDMLARKAEVMVTWAALQSNWAMLTAAACTRYGIHPVLVLFKRYDLPPEYDGNMLLDFILGAEIRTREPVAGKITSREAAGAVIEEVADEFRATGKRVYTISVGGSMPMGSMTVPLGAIGYVDAFVELLGQTRELGFTPDAVLHSSGSGSTQAGLLLGAKALSPSTRIVGISVSDEKAPFARDVETIAAAVEAALGIKTGYALEDIIVFDEFIKEGYGIVNRDVAEVIRRMFRREGIVLDPVYTSKAFAGLVDLIGRGYFRKTDRIVFLHTGGTPALFPNKGKIVELLGGRVSASS